MAHDFALEANIRLFRAQIAIGIDFDLKTAIAEDAFSYHGNHIDTACLGRHNKRCRFVIGVSGARADAADEQIIRIGNSIVLNVARAGIDQALGRITGNRLVTRGKARVIKTTHQDNGVDPHQVAVFIAPTITGASAAIGNLAQHRTSVALYLVRGHFLAAGLRLFQHRWSRRAGRGVVHVIHAVIDFCVLSHF